MVLVHVGNRRKKVVLPYGSIVFSRCGKRFEDLQRGARNDVFLGVGTLTCVIVGTRSANELKILKNCAKTVRECPFCTTTLNFRKLDNCRNLIQNDGELESILSNTEEFEKEDRNPEQNDEDGNASVVDVSVF